MNKKDFIQRWILRTVPTDDDIDKRICQAEKIWSRLDGRGYGNGEKSRPKDHIDHYALIKRKDDFDRFWVAFDYKKDRKGAASAWNRIDPGQELCLKIITAARREALTEHNGTTRKFAQGWLNDRRWEDCTIPSKPRREINDIDPMEAIERQFGKARPELFDNSG